jgi:hypothetical protein
MKLRLILFLLGAGFARAQFTGAVNGVAGQSFGGTFNGNSATTTSVHHIIDAGWSGLSGAQTFRSTFNSDANSLANSVSASSGAAWAYGGYYSSLALPSFNALGQGFANFYGLCQSLGSFTWPSTAGNACANIRGEAFVAATGGAIWGGTFQVQDTDRNYLNAGAVSYAANGLIGLELDTVTTNSGTANAANLYMIDKSSHVSTGFSAYVYGAALVGNTCGTNGTTACSPHTYGLQFAAGSVQSTGSGAWFGPYAPTASSSNSMGINVAGRDAGGTVRTGYIGADLNGAILMYTANNGSTATCAETLGKLGVSGNLRCTDSAGNTQTLGVVYQNTTPVTKTDGATATWTAADILNTVVNESSSANTTITTPTASAITTAFTATGLTCQVGQSWTTSIDNKSSTYSVTLQSGSGVTITSVSGASSISISPGGGTSTQTWRIAACGTPAVTVYETVNTGGGGGTVTSVGLTMPSIFSVSGSPVTTSGTLAVTMTGSGLQPVMANGSAGAPFASTTTTLGTIVDGDCADTPAITLTGAAQGDPVWPGVSANLPAGVYPTAKVTASNTVLVEVCNLSEGPVTLSSATYKVGLLH